MATDNIIYHLHHLDESVLALGGCNEMSGGINRTKPLTHHHVDQAGTAGERHPNANRVGQDIAEGGGRLPSDTSQINILPERLKEKW